MKISDEVKKKVTLYKRTGSDLFQARMKIGKGSGSWQRFSTGCKEESEAWDIAVERYNEKIMLFSHGIAPDTRTFKHCAKIAEKEMKEALEGDTGKVIYEDYIRSLHKYLIPYFGNIKMSNISYSFMKGFDDYRLQMLGRVPSKSVVRNHTSTLNRVFEVDVMRGWMKREDIPVVKHNYKKPERRPYFKENELLELKNFLYSRRWTGIRKKTQEIRAILYEYFILVYYSGIRPGTEADGICFGDIEPFEDNNGQKFIELRVSGKVGERFISCDYMIKSAIDRCRDRVGEFCDDDCYIFGLVCDGGRVPKRLSRPFKAALVECGLLYDKQGRERTLYSLRHSFATGVLLKHGTDMVVIVNKERQVPFPFFNVLKY